MEWLITDHWAFKWGVNLISGAKNRHHIATNAYIPLTYGSASIPDAYGYVGHKYKMDVKAAHGIIRENFGAYKDRDEVFFKMDYRF